MYACDRSKSPPKIRLKMENHEKYESLFRNNNLDNCFRPLHPPPFSLPQVAKADFTSMDKPSISTSTTIIVTPRPFGEATLKIEDPKQDTHDAAVLLASMKKLIDKEIDSKTSLLAIPDFENSAEVTPFTSLLGDVLNSFGNSRVRTVSMDSHFSNVSRGDPSVYCVKPDLKTSSASRNEGPTCISPTICPLMCPIPLEPCHQFATKSPRRGADRRKRYLDDHADDSKEALEEVTISKPKHKKVKICKSGTSKGTSKEMKKGSKGAKTILRKKFSWKNYPELENFLIANREEYLRHSALNYTMQQKQYNNHLTERLVDLASENGYVFDSKVFTFVAIRDRIRCYFKSYVQSRKKRGVIIGYAARKAGLLSEKELERSVVTKVKIVAGGPKCRK
jgi:hypothetical protein